MKKSNAALLVCSSLLLFGCQNEGNNSSEENSASMAKEGSTSIPEEVNTGNKEGDSTAIADDGTVVTIVPEDQRIYIDENTFMDGSDLYKTTENKADKMNRKDEIKVDGKKYYLLYIFPNADDDSKVDLYYEEY